MMMTIKKDEMLPLTTRALLYRRNKCLQRLRKILRKRAYSFVNVYYQNKNVTRSRKVDKSYVE